MDVLVCGLEDFLCKLIICRILENFGEFKVLCDSFCDQVKRYLNCLVLYFNILELIDKGLGVGVYNIKVQDFFIFVCKLFELYYCIWLYRVLYDLV